MTSPIDIAERLFLEPAQMTDQQLQRILGQVLGYRIDYADLYFQNSYQESWVLEDSKVKDGSYNIHRGVGVRATANEKTGFAFSDDITLPALEQAAMAAQSIADLGKQQAVSSWKPLTAPARYGNDNPLDSIQKQQKLDLLLAIDREARRADHRVVEVNATLSGVYETILIARSDAAMAADIRPLVRVNVSVIVEEGGKRETGSSGGGGRFGYQFFLDEERALHYAREAVRKAVLNLHASPAPAGTMPVVLGPGWPGVLLHEAVGHGLEGDFNRKGTSAFSGRIGERVAAPGVTVVDDGTLADRRGSLTCDDEGTPSQCTVLIEDGILKGYMQDNLNARLMGTQSTGNCRRESYAHIPIPRMTNTFMRAGAHDPKEIIASVDKGIYAVDFAGGQVDITSGKFVFSTSEAYLIEKGKVTRPIKGATLIGNGPDVLTRVSMIGDDLRLDSGIGVCGKDGQAVPVGVGQPTLKIDQLTVGGTG